MGLNLEVLRNNSPRITGHTGDKGSWLPLLLTDIGAEVVELSLPAKGPRTLYADIRILPIVATENISNNTKLKSVKEIFYSHRFDYVSCLVSQALVRNSGRNPIETTTTNVAGTSNLTNSASSSISVKGITDVTKHKVYEHHDWVWVYREFDKIGAKNTYSASKATTEFLVIACATSNNSNNILVLTASAGNVPRREDWKEEQLAHVDVRDFTIFKVTKIENLNASRPWQDVLDCLLGYLFVGQAQIKQKTDFPTSINFGSRYAVRVIVLLKIFVESLGKKSEYIIRDSDIYEHRPLPLDLHLTESFLAWVSRNSTQDVIRHTAN